MNGPQNQIPKARKTNARSLHHLEEAQALLPDFPDHSPHEASPAKRYRESRSNKMDIEMGIEAKALWTQIRTENNNQMTGLGELYC